MTEETLGRRIAAHRKRLGLTQDALAEQLGVTAQAVSKWENDQSCPDINMLPKLAEIFGITIDTLLGVEKKEPEVLPVVEAVPEKTAEAPVLPGKRTSVGIAVWLLLAGLVLLAVEIRPIHQLAVSVSVWETVCLTGLMVFGFFGLYPRFSLFRLGCAAVGSYYLYASLFMPPVQLNQELMLPLLLLFFGAGLLVDSIRGKRVPVGHRDWKKMSENQFSCEGNAFSCRTCFGDGHREVRLETLDRGEAEVTFGELSVDIRDCMALGEDACIRLKCSFGSLTLYAPRRWRLQCVNRTAFGTVQEYGNVAPDAESVLRVDCDVSFGEISIKYL